MKINDVLIEIENKSYGRIRFLGILLTNGKFEVNQSIELEPCISISNASFSV